MTRQPVAGKKRTALIVTVAVVAVVDVAIWYARLTPSASSASVVQAAYPSASATMSAVSATPSAADPAQWRLGSSGWQPTSSPPACPSPLALTSSPVDLRQVTSVLYPGQTRGGNYKPHGGFRFDTLSDNKVTVRAPAAASLVRGGRYLVNGETQYSFDFVTPCGIMYRLGHLLTLDPKYAQLADGFPKAAEGDSRMQIISPQLPVAAGETIATEVGTSYTEINTFVDFGVYDLRTRNQAAQDPAWAAQHDPELAQHAVCWFGLLPAADATRVRSLPAADPNSGKNSDYCR